MYAVVGTLCLATASVVSAWAYLQFRRANRGRWTENELPVTAITIVELTLVLCGMILFGRHLVDLADQPFGWMEAATIIAFASALLVSAALLRASWHVRRRRRRLLTARSLPRRAGPRDLRAIVAPRERRGADPIRSRRPADGEIPAKREAA